MKHFLTTLCFLLMSAIAPCFASTEDQSRHIVVNDSNEVIALEAAAFRVLNSDPDSAFLLAREGNFISREINFERGEAVCLNLMGSVYRRRGNYPKALECRYQALKIFEKLGMIPDLILVHNNIAIILGSIQRSQEALTYYFKALHLSRVNDLTESVPMVLSNIADQYEKMNVLDSARIYAHKAYEMVVSLNDTLGRGIISCNLGNIHFKMGQDAISLDYYRLSLADFVRTNNNEGVCEATMGMAKLFDRNRKKDSALYYAHLSYVTAKEGEYAEPLFIASGKLSDLYKQSNNYDSAYFYLAKSAVARDSLFSQEKNRELQNMIFAEQNRQQEIAEAAVIAEKERKDRLQISAIAAFIPAFFAFVLFLSKRRTNKRAIEFLGLLGLLMLFEFITLFIHPTIEKLTHHTPVLMLIILMAIASLLVPLHHKMAGWVKNKLARASERAVIIEEPTVEVPSET